MNEKSRVRELKGIGEKTEKIFQKLGIDTVGDLIRYFPRSYDVYEAPISIGEIEEGKVVTVTGAIYGNVRVNGTQAMQVTTLTLKDMTGTLHVKWFRMPFLRSTLRAGGVLTLRGKVSNRRGVLTMEQPEIFYPSSRYEEKQNTLQPIYPLTTGLTNHTVAKTVRQAIEYLDLKQEFLPNSIRLKYHLAEYNYAIRGIHFPETKEEFYFARERLVFEEFLTFILSLRQIREQEEKSRNPFTFSRQEEVESLIQKLPYELTNAQKNVWNEIRNDMTGTHVMSRLVQGDVGSGKTIIAFLGLMLAGINGYQGAMMAPTEVLAKQHYESMKTMLTQYGIPLQIALLTGSMTAKEKDLRMKKLHPAKWLSL